MGQHGDACVLTGRRRRPFGIALVAALVVLLTVAGPAGPAEAASCTRGYVALTFDDGPSRAHSAKLLNILSQKRAKATFFMLGRAVTARPGRARWTKRAGHRVYNHTYDHLNLANSSNATIRSQVRRAQRALANADARASGKLVRPPYGATNARVRTVLRGMGYRQVLWSVDTYDWRSTTTPSQIVTRVMNGLAPGANVLMHDQEDTQATVKALPRIIRKVRQRGYCLGVVNKWGNVRKARASS